MDIARIVEQRVGPPLLMLHDKIYRGTDGRIGTGVWASVLTPLMIPDCREIGYAALWSPFRRSARGITKRMPERSSSIEQVLLSISPSRFA